MKKLTVFILCMFSIGIFASPPTRTFSYESGTSINPTHVTTNEDNIYTYLQAGVDTLANNAVTTSAKITDGIILNADINSSAAIAGSKLNLAVPGAIGGTTPAAGTFTTVALTSAESGTPTANTIYKETLVKAWANLNGTGTAAYNDSFNISGVTDGGTGIYTFTFDVDFANNDYSVVHSISEARAAMSSYSVGSVLITVKNSAGSNTDADNTCIAVFGDQ